MKILNKILDTLTTYAPPVLGILGMLFLVLLCVSGVCWSIKLLLNVLGVI